MKSNVVKEGDKKLAKTATKSKKSGKGKTKAKAEAKRGRKPSFDSPVELRLSRMEGMTAKQRKEAAKNFVNKGEIPDVNGVSSSRMKWALMQQAVESGLVERVKDSDAAIKRALQEDEYNTNAWVACRAGTSGDRISEIVSDLGIKRRGRQKGAKVETSNGAKATKSKRTKEKTKTKGKGKSKKTKASSNGGDEEAASTKKKKSTKSKRSKGKDRRPT